MLADGDNRRDPHDGTGDKMPVEYLSVESFFDGFATQQTPTGASNSASFGDPMQLFDDSLITLATNTDPEQSSFVFTPEDRRAQSFSSLPELPSGHSTAFNNSLDPILAEASIPLSLDCYVAEDESTRRRGPKRRRSAPAATNSSIATTTSAFMQATAGRRSKGPGSPRGRPRSLYKPGEKPVPPNIYNVITSPAMNSLKPSPLSPTMNTSPVMSTGGEYSLPSLPHHLQPPNSNPHNPQFYTSQAWSGPAPLMPASNGVGYWGFHPYHPAYLAAINAPHAALARPAAFSATSVPKVPITAGPAEADIKSFLRMARPDRGSIDSPTSSLTSTGSPDDHRRSGGDDGRAMIHQTRALKHEFLSATRNLDRDSVTVLEMKQILRRFSLPCNGKKDDLIGRIAGIRQELMGANPSTDILI